MKLFSKVILSLALLMIASESRALSIATWNVEQGSVENLTRRAEPIARLATELKRNMNGSLPDVLILDEVTSYASTAFLARRLGYASATAVTTDAGNDRDIWPAALEVAVITTRRIISATSYQSRPNDRFPPFVHSLSNDALSAGSVQTAIVPAAVALPQNTDIPRAILRLELEGGLVIYAVHLNSSGLGFCRLDDALAGATELKTKAEALGLTTEAAAIGDSIDKVRASIAKAKNPGISATKDEALKRARTREAAAAVVVTLAHEDVRQGKSVFVAGDFNVPLVEPCKTGHKLDEDFEPLMGCATKIDATACGATDGFDDTFAILTEGLVSPTRFKVLTSAIGRTYANPAFVDSPIDNVLVAGQLETRTFTATKVHDSTGGKPFGSDHYPVLVDDGQRR